MLFSNIHFHFLLLFNQIIADGTEKNPSNKFEKPMIRISRTEIQNVRLSAVRREIQQLEKLEQELKAKLDAKLDTKSKF